MADTTMRDALAYIKEHSEVFSSAINKKGEIDVAALESLAVRGDALVILQRKFPSLSSDARGEFLDSCNVMAADVLASCEKSGTSGDQQFKITTPSGTFRVILSDQVE